MDTDTHREDGRVTIEAEVRVMHLQAKDSQQHQNLEEAGSTLLQPLEGNQPYGHPDFRLLSPRVVPGPQPQKTQWQLTRSLPSESWSLILAPPWPCGLWAFRASGCRLCPQSPPSTGTHVWASSRVAPGSAGPLLLEIRLPSDCGCNAAMDQTGVLGNQRHGCRQKRVMCCL